MRRLWDITSRLVQEDSRIGVFLAVNLVLWTGVVLLAGIMFCGILAVPAEVYMLNVMCAAIYAGIIIGLLGGIVFIMKNKSV